MGLKTKIKVIFCIAAVCVFGVIGCGETADGDRMSQIGEEKASAGQLRPVRWKIYGPPIGRRVRIISEVGHCAGTEKPGIGVVHVDERVRLVLLTAMLTVGGSGRGEGCAGVRIGLHKIVRLERPLGERALYDASVSPPAKRWPRP